MRYQRAMNGSLDEILESFRPDAGEKQRSEANKIET